MRNGKLFTLDELTVEDFLEKFEYLGIDKSYFEETRIILKKRFRVEIIGSNLYSVSCILKVNS